MVYRSVSVCCMLLFLVTSYTLSALPSIGRVHKQEFTASKVISISLNFLFTTFLFWKKHKQNLFGISDGVQFFLTSYLYSDINWNYSWLKIIPDEFSHNEFRSNGNRKSTGNWIKLTKKFRNNGLLQFDSFN